ncbi:GNAT family N-acetyltransferase [Arcicella rosea]|uniref:GNAT superfamily N-acetyltransferase n=1 Tax=Arcicella rosea TaxID=502909 RepID=A0A841ETU0_9BACT|nr:GNAT family N-acetyltransferase [Arcicella rosea]MBB6002871.1 GNAT superfamily N-acetyltransferase [Arcicella rosea]
MQTLSFIQKKGAEITTIFEDLANLRITVFRDFPYLYEGSVAYEMEYLKIYAQAEKALLFAVYDGSKMVGATTCIPLINEAPEVHLPFEKVGLAIDSIFYFGESILLKEYRGLGLGHRFFDEREAHARSFGTFKTTCFCAVDRGENHPLQPENYRPNDAFWLKRGYQKDFSLQSTFEWPDINESVSTPKTMIYWKRDL